MSRHIVAIRGRDFHSFRALRKLILYTQLLGGDRLGACGGDFGRRRCVSVSSSLGEKKRIVTRSLTV